MFHQKILFVVSSRIWLEKPVWILCNLITVFAYGLMIGSQLKGIIQRQWGAIGLCLIVLSVVMALLLIDSPVLTLTVVGISFYGWTALLEMRKEEVDAGWVCESNGGHSEMLPVVKRAYQESSLLLLAIKWALLCSCTTTAVFILLKLFTAWYTKTYVLIIMIPTFICAFLGHFNKLAEK